MYRNFEFKAFAAAQRIMNELELINLDFNDPYQVLGNYDLCPQYIYWGSGASRYVIWDDEYDFAIKFARDEVYEKYNEAELELYSRAKALGIEKNFAWIEKFTSSYIDDDGKYMPAIYVVEYLRCNEGEVDDTIWDYGYKNYCEANGLDSSTYDYADEYTSMREDDSDEAMDYFLSQMVDEEKHIVWTFILDNDINDLHTGNYSFRGERLVIHDYAGWGW